VREALALALDPHAPASGQPGRMYYSNLAFFLGNLAVPGGSDALEKTLYLALVRRIKGEMGSDTFERVQRELITEIERQDTHWRDA
jgi:hypothetical protein